MRWRVTVRWHSGPETVREVDAAQLRALHEELLADPGVAGFSTPWRVADEEVPAVCPACGWVFDGATNDVAYHECQCGLIHVRRKCRKTGCWAESFTPEKGEGCRPIPYDREGVENRLYRKGGRKWTPVKDR